MRERRINTGLGGVTRGSGGGSLGPPPHFEISLGLFMAYFGESTVFPPPPQRKREGCSPPGPREFRGNFENEEKGPLFELLLRALKGKSKTPPPGCAPGGTTGQMSTFAVIHFRTNPCKAPDAGNHPFSSWSATVVAGCWHYLTKGN